MKPIVEAAAMETRYHTVHASLPLASGSTLCIDDGREVVVHVREGCMWLTQERDRRDIVVKAGERFEIDCPGRTLILALREGVVVLTSPYARCYARRIDMLRTGETQPRPLYQAERGWRGALAAFKTGLMKTWVGLYAAPRRVAHPL